MSPCRWDHIFILHDCRIVGVWSLRILKDLQFTRQERHSTSSITPDFDNKEFNYYRLYCLALLGACSKLPSMSTTSFNLSCWFSAPITLSLLQVVWDSQIFQHMANCLPNCYQFGRQRSYLRTVRIVTLALGEGWIVLTSSLHCCRDRTIS